MDRCLHLITIFYISKELPVLAHPNSSSSKGRAAIRRSLPEPEQKGKIRSRIPGIFLFSFSGVTSRGQGSAPSPKRDTATAASRFARPGNTGVIYLLWIREIPIPRGPREAFRLVAVWDRGSGGRDWAPGLPGGQLPKAGQRRGRAPGLLTRRFGFGHGGDNGIDIVELLLEVGARLLIMSLHGVDPAVSRSQQ